MNSSKLKLLVKKEPLVGDSAVGKNKTEAKSTLGKYTVNWEAVEGARNKNNEPIFSIWRERYFSWLFGHSNPFMDQIHSEITEELASTLPINRQNIPEIVRLWERQHKKNVLENVEEVLEFIKQKYDAGKGKIESELSKFSMFRKSGELAEDYERRLNDIKESIKNDISVKLAYRGRLSDILEESIIRQQATQACNAIEGSVETDPTFMEFTEEEKKIFWDSFFIEIASLKPKERKDLEEGKMLSLANKIVKGIQNEKLFKILLMQINQHPGFKKLNQQNEQGDKKFEEVAQIEKPIRIDIEAITSENLKEEPEKAFQILSEAPKENEDAKLIELTQKDIPVEVEETMPETNLPSVTSEPEALAPQKIIDNDKQFSAVKVEEKLSQQNKAIPAKTFQEESKEVFETQSKVPKEDTDEKSIELTPEDTPVEVEKEKDIPETEAHLLNEDNGRKSENLTQSTVAGVESAVIEESAKKEEKEKMEANFLRVTSEAKAPATEGHEPKVKKLPALKVKELEKEYELKEIKYLEELKEFKERFSQNEKVDFKVSSQVFIHRVKLTIVQVIASLKEVLSKNNAGEEGKTFLDELNKKELAENFIKSKVFNYMFSEKMGKVEQQDVEKALLYYMVIENEGRKLTEGGYEQIKVKMNEKRIEVRVGLISPRAASPRMGTPRIPKF